MANPLTSLRKLGVKLVADDGMLSNAASIYLGSGPMDRLKLQLEARKQADADNSQDVELATNANRLQNDIDKAKREDELFPIQKEREKAALDSQKATTNKTIQDTEFEKANRDRELADIKSTIDAYAKRYGISPEEARSETLLAEFMHKNNLTDMGQVPPNILSDLGINGRKGILADSALTLIRERNKMKHDDAMDARTAQRAAAAEERQGKINERADRNYEMSDFQTTRRRLQDVEDMLVRGEGVDALVNYAATKAQKDGYSGKLIVTEQAVINQLNKGLDPTSVVREGEYARTTQSLAALDRIRGLWQQMSEGGTIPLDLVKEIHNAYRTFLRAQEDWYNSEISTFGQRHEQLSPEDVKRKYFPRYKGAMGPKKEVKDYFSPRQ